MAQPLCHMHGPDTTSWLAPAYSPPTETLAVRSTAPALVSFSAAGNTSRRRLRFLGACGAGISTECLSILSNATPL